MRREAYLASVDELLERVAFLDDVGAVAHRERADRQRQHEREHKQCRQRHRRTHGAPQWSLQSSPAQEEAAQSETEDGLHDLKICECGVPGSRLRAEAGGLVGKTQTD